MRCPVCGLAGTGRFCQECATKLVEDDQAEQTIVCEGQLENGSPCATQLTTKQRFCWSCGRKVDISIFFERKGKDETALKNNAKTFEGVVKKSDEERKGLEKVKVIQADNSKKLGNLETTNVLGIIDNVKAIGQLDNKIRNVDTENGTWNLYTEQTTTNLVNADLAENVDNVKEKWNVDIVNVIENVTSERKTGSIEQEKEAGHVKPEKETENVGRTKETENMEKGKKMETGTPDSAIEMGNRNKEEEARHVDDKETDHKDNCEGTMDVKDPLGKYFSDEGSSDSDDEKDMEHASISTAGETMQKQSSQKKQKRTHKTGRDIRKEKEKEKRERKKKKHYKARKTNKPQNDTTEPNNATEEISALYDQSEVQLKTRVFGGAKIDTSTSNGNSYTGGLFDFGVGKQVSATTEKVNLDRNNSGSQEFMHEHHSGHQNEPIRQNAANETDIVPMDEKSAKEDTNNQKKHSSLSENEGGQTKQRVTDKHLETQHREANINDPKKTNYINSNKNEANTSQINMQHNLNVKVHFHVLLSPNFKFDAKTDNVIIRFGIVMLDGWKSEKWILKHICTHESGEQEFHTTIDIPRKHMLDNGVDYKYFIKRFSLTNKGKRRKHIWENYERHGSQGPRVNRKLKLEDKLKNSETWYQFDGMVNRKREEGWFSKVKHGVQELLFGKTDLRTNANRAMVVFSDNIVKDIKRSTDADRIIKSCVKAQCLAYCMWRVYVADNTCWNSEENINKEISGHLISPLFDHILSFLPKPVEEEDRVFLRRMLATMALLMLVDRLKVSSLSKDRHADANQICISLLPSLSASETRCKELDHISQYFPENRTTVAEVLVRLVCEIAEHNKNPAWLFLMPLIHFLSGACEPCEPVKFDISHDADIPLWWGTARLNHGTIEKFKKQITRWEMPVGEVIEKLAPCFSMDYMLPRTIMACLNLSEVNEAIQTGLIPLEVNCATMIYHLKTTRPPYTHTTHSSPWGYVTSDEKVTFHCLNSLHEIASKDYASNTRQCSDVMQLQLRMTLDLSMLALQADRMDPVLSSTALYLYAYSQLKKTTEMGQENEDLNNSFSKLLLALCEWFRRYNSNFSRDMDNTMMYWNAALEPDILLCDEIARIAWNKSLLDCLRLHLTAYVEQVPYQTKQFVEYYCRKFQKFKLCLQECMNEIAYEAINHAYEFDINLFLGSERKTFGWLLCRMMESNRHNLLETNVTGEEVSLQLCLSWSPLLQFVKIYKTKGSNKQWDILDDECSFLLARVISKLEDSFRLLREGEIPIGDLKVIQQNEQVYANLLHLISSDNQTQVFKGRVLQLIEMRMKELTAFKEHAAWMSTLVGLCQHKDNVERNEVDDVLRKQKDLDKHALTEFCETGADDVNLDNLKDYTPRITAFKVSEDILRSLPLIHKCNDSHVFIKMWTDRCIQDKAEKYSLEEVFEKIWVPVKTSWDTVRRSIKDGDIKFSDIEALVGKVYREDYHRIEEEFKRLGISQHKAEQRVKQLKQFRELTKCSRGARTVLKFSHEFKVTGSFEDIRKIANYDSQDFKMKEFNLTLMNTCVFLQELTPERSRCLEIFVKCGNFVKWLKDSMSESGLKELKVFVDLASMSAGDEPINIARVKCLHSAVTGFAPLIFDLKPTDGYKELIKHCSIIWKELEANPNLPDQLEATNLHLEWLKHIKTTHGSVEVTSLCQAEAINDNGIYRVGSLVHRSHGVYGQQDQGMSISLSVAEEKDKKNRRKYTCAHLQDLQSRLMLVIGKAELGNSSVERFTEIFDSVTRLSHAYAKLRQAGCALFTNWTATFLCDIKIPVCVIMEFGKAKIKGRRTRSEDLQCLIPRLASVLEMCYEEWLTYIKTKRKYYEHLNYFTVDQLVILQTELMKLTSTEEPSHLIYPLLSAVKRNCTKSDLMEAMKEAKESFVRDMDQMLTLEEDSDENSQGMVDEDKERSFVQYLQDSGYSESVSRKALVAVGPDDVSEGIAWCIEHLDTGSGVEVTTGEDNEDERGGNSAVFAGWSQTTESMQTIISARIANLKRDRRAGVNSLLEELQQLWSAFLGCLSTDMKDYLNLDHLGKILCFLAQKDAFSVERMFPTGLEEGAPNLIICPQGEVLQATLGMYMVDKAKPLPQSDEVLLCSRHTTLDEVDIFWRRAIFHGGGKIHCLVHADILDFDVSEASEKILDDYIKEIHGLEPNYRLVVICGSDNANRSRIVASLFKYRRHTFPHHVDTLKKYLCDKLRVLASTDIRPASHVDFDKSSVRLIKSWRAGVGKTLYKERMEQKLCELNRNTKSRNVSIPLTEKAIEIHNVMTRLLEHTDPPGQNQPRIIHFDLANEVHNGADFLLFNLLVLGCLVDSSGFVWRKSAEDLYLVETMPLMVHYKKASGSEVYRHKMLGLLPEVECMSPMESVSIYTRPQDIGHVQLFDKQKFESAEFQRPFQYLIRLDQRIQLNDVNPNNVEGSPLTCLQTLLKYCGVRDPSWAELYHFVSFLNTQLHDFERNEFVGPAAAKDLPGFSQFVLQFLIQMSKDFSTRSLNMSEESLINRPQELAIHEDDYDHGNYSEDDEDTEGEILQRYQLRRTWETSPHPYLFINADRTGFTFLGFYLDRNTGNLIDQQTGEVLQHGIIRQNLFDALVRNRIPVQENFDNLSRADKITKLCSVMGNDMPSDSDDTYELTTDNAKKIMAIFMRFRCNIPVIIMGETGCGKTRLVKYMCSLLCPPGVAVNNMILMKVHGGTSKVDIKLKVEKAEKIARKNMENFGSHFFTVLFFDEANTTEAIGLIKEIMCDKSLEGEKLYLCENLKMIAACNPYRKHSDELIQKLEKAGLGYHIKAEDTEDTIGRIPMRQLVYRVQPLPQSLIPLVWDFGQLNTEVEERYIRQIVRRYIHADMLPDIPGLPAVISSVLTASQSYMRQQKDECSFVSLRDVDRVLCVMSWFYNQNKKSGTLFKLMDQKLEYSRKIYDSQYGEVDDDDDEEEEGEEENDDDEDDGNNLDDSISDITRCLVLSLGVCYHACLRTRDEYKIYIAEFFSEPCRLPGGSQQIDLEINACQEVFLDKIDLERNIARNMALKENVFMMVVCIELRIPLFLVGKPGSSKSLAKTVVADAMQGKTSEQQLFRELKQAHMVSFQCSPLSTPDGILATFRQCSQFQENKDLNTFVSIVVLDEVGLAEDSPKMPLKTLHPLLEDGCQTDEKPEPHKKVAFIGISNWALDPAKMNRGVLVQREVPDIEELCNSARGICESGQMKEWLKPLIEPLAMSYLDIFNKATLHMREFYGLRDFYSLVKMINMFVEQSKRQPTWHEMVHAIKRNFGGMDQVEPVECFKNHVCTIVPFEDQPKEGDPDCSTSGLIQACLFNKVQSESRYLLLLTENYGALTILQQQLLSRQTDIRPITIFGSSFRSDQEYTQVCRNINKIKVCMETGNTVILLNLENLYESLYDALNQYYVYYGGVRFVDLGLGTHRVKCPVHPEFRLIVVAEKQTVYKEFPIPLINRLEKHFLTINTMLTDRQQTLVRILENWASKFASQRQNHATRRRFSPGDVFMGYHDDTCSAVILHVDNAAADDAQVVLEAKKTLLWCTSPAGVVRLKSSDLLPDEQKQLAKIYLEEQSHDSLVDYLHHQLVQDRHPSLLAQVTTHSKLLATFHTLEISKKTEIPHENILLLDTLASFDTEQQFSTKLFRHFDRKLEEPSLLIVQCDSGEKNGNLIACARYCVMDEYENVRDSLTAPVHIVFIVQLSHSAEGSFTGFQSGIWHSVHIDDLYTEDFDLPKVTSMQNKPIATLLGESLDQDYVSAETTTFSDNGLNNRGDALNDVYEVMLEFEQLWVTEIKTDQHLSTPDKTLNCHKLILRCIHLALSMVKDLDDGCLRTTERIRLLLKLLSTSQDEERSSFIKGVTRLVVKLLEERDKKLGFYLSGQWLSNEAAAQETLQRTGTFRQACLQTVESKIAPVLAGIIAYLDTNQNLDLVSDTALPWQQQLWLAFICNYGILSLKYADLVSPLKESDLPEFTVKRTGSEGHNFNARMPFSWEIHDIVETIVSQHIPDKDQDTTEDKINLFCNVFSKSIGQVLLEIVSPEMFDEVSNSYLSDLVHMKYHAAFDEEHTLVCNTVQSAQQNMLLMEHRNIVIDIVCSHMATRKVAKDMNCFRAICNVWPDCSKVYTSLKQQKSNHFLITDTRLVVAAVYLLIESITPEKGELNSHKGRDLWLKKVHKYRPVVESVLKTYDKDKHEHSQNCMEKARLLWNRVVIVKLFLEHVCVSSSSDKITVNLCMPLWMTLRDNADMKEIHTITAVERFLKACNTQALTEYFGKIEKCSVCEKKMEGALLIMPCEERVCEVCMIEGKSIGQCPKCSTPLPNNFEPGLSTAQIEAETRMKDYQKRCNSFFMDAVSQLCFTDNTPPSGQVVSRLLSYITCAPRQTDSQNQGTKPMSVFDTGLDPTPVFRSFLLQHLLRSSEVHLLLRQYMEHVALVLKKQRQTEGYNHHTIQLSLLVIHCLEDLYKSQAFTDEVGFATCILSKSLEHLSDEKLTETKLCSLAGARMGLGVAADYIRRSLEGSLNRRQKKLVESAYTICSNNNSKWLVIYLVKYICRSYGVETYIKLCAEVPYRWLRLECMHRSRIEMPDRFTIIGETYRILRESLTQVILGEDINLLTERYQGLKTGTSRVDLILQLVLYREVTSARLYPADQNRIHMQATKELDDFISTSGVKYQNFCHDLVHNRLPGRLRVKEQEDMYTQGVQCLLLHFFCTLTDIQGNRTLIQPLIGLMKNPQQYTRCFVPTMPQDDLEDIKEALLAGRNNGENPVLYRCPNGHPYVIGNCGRPAVVSKCKICHADIGGQNHVLRNGNVLHQGGDETKTGHILGHANQRGEELTTERSLTPAQCACLRLLTHMALYLASLQSAQEMEDLFQPRLAPQEIPDFLWQHISADLNNLRNTLGRNQDDIFLIVHLALLKVINQNDPGEMLSQEMCLLSSKTGRRDWEQKFVQKFLQPILKNVDHALKKYNQVIATDQRLGGDPLLCLLYETETKQLEPDPDRLQEVDQVWHFRTPISLNHLRLELQNSIPETTRGKRQHQVLHYFLESEPILRALILVPSILRLQKVLLHKYQRRLDRAEASTLTLKHLKRDNVLGSETHQLLGDFQTAWEIVRSNLKYYACPSEFGEVWVREDLCCHSVDDETPLAMLLPTTRDLGLCSYALLDFLMRKQNEFLDLYNKNTARRDLSNRSSVDPADVTSSHLVSFDRQRDLMPLIYANCQYTFALGKGTIIEYDFTGIERQVMDRFCFSKSRINIRRYLKIDLMIYRTEFTNAHVFADLAEKIHQIDLNQAVKQQICSETASLPELCKSLDHLDIAISFLKSIGGEPSMPLAQFMQDTLQMDSPIHSQKAQQSCQLQHAKSLWLLFALQRSKIMLPKGNRKTLIEAVPEEHTECIEESSCEDLKMYLNNLTVERLSQFVEVFHEFILLKVAVKVNRDAEDYTDNRESPLVDHLVAYVELLDEPPLETFVLEAMPDEILLKHSVHTWMVACQKLFEKQRGKTR